MSRNKIIVGCWLLIVRVKIIELEHSLQQCWKISIVTQFFAPVFQTTQLMLQTLFLWNSSPRYWKDKTTFRNYTRMRAKNRRWYPDISRTKIGRERNYFWGRLPIINVEIIELGHSLQQCWKILIVTQFFAHELQMALLRFPF